MPNPGGSTGHASNFIFPIEYSKMMMELTRDSTEQYQAARRVHRERRHRGGPDRRRGWHELRRRCTAAKAWGIPGQLVSPAEVAKLVPVPGRVGDPGRRALPDRRRRRLAAGRHADARGGAAGRRPAGAWPAPRCSASRPPGRPQRAAGSPRVRTTAGDIETEYVRGLLRRVEPAHRPDGRGPDPAHADRAPDDQRRARSRCSPARRARSRTRSCATWTPTCTSGSTAGTWRSARTRTGRSSSAPTTSPPSRSPSLSPDRAAVHSGRLRPAAGRGAGADAGAARRREGRHPVRDQRPDLDDPGRPSRCSVRRRRSTGCGRSRRAGSRRGRASGRAVAEWMSGQRARDRRARGRHRPVLRRTSGPARMSRRGPARASTRCTGSCTRPSSGSQARPIRVSPAYDRERDLGAVFFETAGWERPHWYASNERAAGPVRGAADAARRGVGRALVVADHQRRAPRHAGRDAALVDLSRVRGLRRHRAVARSGRCSRWPSRSWTWPPGRVVYTSLLDERGGFKADLTIMRLGARAGSGW